MGKTTDIIRKKIKKKEEILGRNLTRKERQNIIKNIKRKRKIENFIKGGFLAVGITIGAGGHALLTSGNNEERNVNIEQDSEMQINDEKDNKINEFTESLKVDKDISKIESKKEQVNYDKEMLEILNEYNSKYNLDLRLEDITYIKSNPQFLGIDDNGTYIQDYKENTLLKESIDDDIEDIYIIINKNDNKIISSLGKISENIVNIDTKVVMDYNRNEYFESDKKMDLTKNKSLDQINDIYITIENQYEKQQQKEENEI